MVLASCGGKTGLQVPDFDREDGGPRRDTGRDVGGIPDAGIDAPIDVGVDSPDTFIPLCPGSISVVGREASVPVDIIWAIDSSGSMIDDTERMRANISLFWDSISTADVDARVIFVGQAGFVPGAPAGFSGRYTQINRRVGSTDALLQLLATHRDYQTYLRPDATTHFIVVTDDDSLGLDWEDFRSEMETLLAHDFTFHAVASERVMPSIANPYGACFHPGGTATRPGTEYYEMATATGGVQLSICNEDWGALFPILAERIAVRIPIPCAYSLPILPPAGITYDPDNFTVLLQVPGEPGPRRIPAAGSEAGCGDGWWYFGGSQRVTLCDSTCAEVEALDGRITVDLGCTRTP